MCFSMNQSCSRLVPALLVLFVMTANAETPPAVTPGLEGVIVVSPSRPGPLKKDAPEAAPVGHISFDVQKGEQKVASFTTDAEGHFQVSLPPGHYIIARNDPGASVGAWRFEADVVAGEVTKVRWTGDSGMR
jgi:hypothetical protein